MRYLSVCSGIEAATVAWHPLGWEAVAYSEIERFPSEVLAHHYPNTPNVGDMTKFKEWTNVSDVNLLVGGTPCQSFSVAGLRKGLDDPRGNLMLTYLAIARQHRPRWLVWENVPGVLSSNGGLDFASLLRGMGELGYGFAYRILDAQYFGVAQRRRRVFVVGYLGDWRAAAAVLFERHSLSGNPAPRREKGKGITASVKEGASIGSLCAKTGQSISVQDASQGHLMQWPPEIAPTIDAHFGNKQGLENQHINGGGECLPLVSKCLITKNRMDAETETLIPITGGHFSCEPIALAENTIGRKPENGGNGDKFTDGGPMYTLNATGVHGVAQPVYEMHGQDSRVRELGDVCTTVSATYGTGGGNVPVTLQPIGFDAYNNDVTGDVSKTIDTGQDYHHVPNILQHMAVRRLTPKECERLQGFGDNYTDIQTKGKPTPDGPRYKALGNSMAVPVMRWIGERIQKVEALNVS
jgi:DNA (cytosine-5)-methyltransferase 1